MAQRKTVEASWAMPTQYAFSIASGRIQRTHQNVLLSPSAYQIDFHLVKDVVVKVGDFLRPTVEGESPSQFFLGQTGFRSLPIEQPDFNHVTTFGLSTETAGSQIRYQNEAFQQSAS